MEPKLGTSTAFEEDTVLLIDEENSSSSYRSPITQNQSLKTVTETALPAYDSLVESESDQAILFRVGDERKLLIGQKSKMAAASPIFSAMFRGPWRKEREVDVPDLQPEAFKILLRHTEGPEQSSSNSRLTDSNVWHVLKAADKYQVLSLVSRCLHHLLNTHSAHQSPEHLTAVLELAHYLQYGEDHERCLSKVKSLAGRVLRSADALSQLCYDCLLSLLRADDLAEADERVVHQAVMTWARCSCRQEGLTSEMTSHVQMMSQSDTTSSHLPPDPASDLSSKIASEAESEVDEELTTDTESQILPKVTLQMASQMTSEPNSEMVSDTKSETTSHSRPEAASQATPHLLTDGPAQRELERGLQPTPHPASQPKTDPTPHSRAEPTPQADQKPETPPSWKPTRQEMRAAAGQLVYHVRYLTLPRPELQRLLSEPSSSCLLSEQEVDDLLNNSGSKFFPESVRQARKETTKKILKAERDSRQRKKRRWCVLVVLILLLTFLFQYMCVKLLVGHILPLPERPVNSTVSECGGQSVCS